MFDMIRRWWAERRRDRQAIEAAARFFEIKTGAKALRGISRILHHSPGQRVVRICYGQHITPPSRAWFVVMEDGSILQELTFEQVRQFGERRWR